MKNNLENSIKESLKDYEMAYNPKAWEAMSAKLDAAQPSSSLENGMKESLEDLEMPYNPKAWEALRAKLDIIKPISAPAPNFKWYAIAATAVVATVSAFFYFTHDGENASSQDIVTNDTIQAIDEELNNVSIQDNKVHANNTALNSTNTSSNNTSNEAQLNEVNGSYQANNSTVNSSVNSSNGSTQAVNNTSVDQASNNGGSNNGGSTTKPSGDNGSQKVNFVSPVTPNLCQNESIDLNNENSLKLWVIAPSGETFHVKPMDEGTFKANETGVHKVGYYHAEDFVETGSFNVKSLPTVDFYIDEEQKYENGVPVTKVETNVPGSAFNWKIGNVTASGREAEGHFFKKGYYDITLDVTGANGCVNSKTEKYHIEHEYGDRGNYNLLAPSGIHLNSMDEKNRTFMPEGLKLRDVKFRMVIYSLQDGHVVYETQDSSKPWNGVDQSTGRQVGHATSYHWEVTIENPMSGESPSYKGGLTVLIN